MVAGGEMFREEMSSVKWRFLGGFEPDFGQNGRDETVLSPSNADWLDFSRFGLENFRICPETGRGRSSVPSAAFSCYALA